MYAEAETKKCLKHKYSATLPFRYIARQFGWEEVAGFTAEKQMLHGLVMMLIATAYTLILTKTLPKNQSLNWDDAEHR